jgi:hypothetical protein
MNNQTEIRANRKHAIATPNRAKRVSHPQYSPGNLLDALIGFLALKNDAALSRALEVAPPLISKIRNRGLPVSAAILIRMHEVSQYSVAELRFLMGDQRQKFRIGTKQFKPIGADI